MARKPARAPQTITVTDYADPEINRLAVALHALADMTEEERGRAFSYFKRKFSAEWPSDSY